ncbi:MAG: hypothetical protein OHK0029_20140 [Armatimonadaceae bacterium]
MIGAVNTKTFDSAGRVALALILLLTAFRLFYAATTDITNDETHYWQWSRFPALSYFDQGPAIAWCIRLGTTLWGHTPLGVRFVGVLLAAGTSWMVFRTAQLWLGGRAALWALCLLAIAPLLMVGGIIATYDGPQVFCWAAALYFLTRTVQEDRPAFWYGVGAFVGLGLLSKLTMILFAPCVLVFLLLSPQYRRHLFTPHPWLAFGLALVLFSPVLYWNATHQWSMFQHAAALNSRSRGAPPLRWFGEFLGGQAVVLSPFLFLAELAVLTGFGVKLVKQRILVSEGERFVWSFSAPILLLCLFISLRSKMEANWPAPAHLMGIVLVALWFAGLWQSGRALARSGIVVSVGLSVVMIVVLLFPTILPTVGLRLTAFQAQKLLETYGWDPVMRGVQAARERLEAEGKPVYLAGVNYRVPSLMAFHLPDHPRTVELFFATRRDQYFFWTDPDKMIGANVVLCVDDDKKEVLPLAQRYFESVETIEPVIVRHPGFTGEVKHWRIHLCRGFKGYDPEEHVEGW